MRKYILCLALLPLSVSTLKAQEVAVPINTGVANFLNIPTDARSASMGGVGVAVTGNSNAVFHNGATALIGNEHKAAFTYTFIPWMREHDSGYSLNTIGGNYKLNSRSALIAGFRYFNYPKVNIVENETATGKSIRPKEFAIDLGYAHEIFDNFAVSGTIKYIHSDMGNLAGAKSANAVAFDIGALCQGNINLIDGTIWTAGLQLSNFGTKIKYLNTEEQLPAFAKLGGTISVPFADIHKLMVAADGGYRILPSATQSFNISAGLEYTLLDRYMLRGGYHYGDKNKGDSSYATAGLGIDYKGINVGFAWLFAGSDNLAKNTFWVSAGYSF